MSLRVKLYDTMHSFFPHLSLSLVTKMNLLKSCCNTVNYYHKALHLGCCSSPRSASAYPHSFLANSYFSVYNLDLAKPRFGETIPPKINQFFRIFSITQ